MDNSEITTFIIFVFIAVIRTILDIILWQILVWIFTDKSRIVVFFKKFNLNKFALAQAISFIFSAVISYLTNKQIAFGNTEPDSLGLILKFSLVTGIGLVASVWVIEVLTTNSKILKAVKEFPLLNKYWPLVAKLVTVGITLIINYIGFRFWVFN